MCSDFTWSVNTGTVRVTVMIKNNRDDKNNENSKGLRVKILVNLKIKTETSMSKLA